MSETFKFHRLMRRTSAVAGLVCVALVSVVAAANREASPPPRPRAEGKGLIPPATPLVACDPYFSVWSFADRLTDDTPRHWTGRAHGLASLIRIDGQAYRLMGVDPEAVPALPQIDLKVLPTRTRYEFSGAGVLVALTFMTGSLPHDLDLLSRPVTYLEWDCRATDGQAHEVVLYFDATAELVVNDPAQEVVGETSSLTVPSAAGPSRSENATVLAVTKLGSKEQAVLAKHGDDLRIDWGYLYGAAGRAAVRDCGLVSAPRARRSFASTGTVPTLPEMGEPRAVNDGLPAAAFAFDLGRVTDRPVSRWLMLAYDDLYSIQYMKQNLRPYWRRDGAEATDLLIRAALEYPSLRGRCAAFDAELMADLERVGGEKYARVCALAYRQAFAANKFVADAHGQPLSFSKENFSNGCIGTVDVFYPMAPQFLLFGPSLTKSMLVPLLNYAASERWKFPFAPHDLGTYPHANGQRYGGGERSEENQMPVEETGNMLILMAALAQMEGDAGFCGSYWPMLVRWAEYLKAKGFDPENQLCTDDFAGHLAHNVNLSAKAICGLAAFGRLCALRGEAARAREYDDLARSFAQQWVKQAADGDHYRLAFDRPGTWSQKYNLVWDRLLGFDLFPDEVRRAEMDYYRKIQNRYGLPLDNRQSYTKLDWILWTATLTGEPDDFAALLDPVYRFLNETPDRVPMTDWYWTDTGRRRGFQARPVVGGVFLKMLYDADVWKKWAAREMTRASGWAPLPKPPQVKTVVPTAQSEAVAWRYTQQQPARDWFAPDFNDHSWTLAPAGFGTRGTPGAVIRTEWNTPQIWLRREFELSSADLEGLHLWMHHDEDAAVYLNGMPAVTASGYTVDYEILPIAASALASLEPGCNVLAIHCRQTSGGQYIDAGLVRVFPTSARP